MKLEARIVLLLLVFATVYSILAIAGTITAALAPGSDAPAARAVTFFCPLGH